MRVSRVAAVGVVAGLGWASCAGAAVLDPFRGAPTFTDTRVDTYNVAGWGFSVTTGTKQVDSLGYYVSPTDSGGTGVLAIAHTVALYDLTTPASSTYTLVASAVIPAGSTADATGYAWVTLATPITLSDTGTNADQYVVEATNGTDRWGPYTGTATVAVLDPTFGTPSGAGRFSGGNDTPGAVGSTLSIPSGAGNGGYFGGNIGLSTPEPASLALISLGAGSLLARRRRA